jgi:hypothetical protein
MFCPTRQLFFSLQRASKTENKKVPGNRSTSYTFSLSDKSRHQVYMTPYFTPIYHPENITSVLGFKFNTKNIFSRHIAHFNCKFHKMPTHTTIRVGLASALRKKIKKSSFTLCAFEQISPKERTCIYLAYFILSKFFSQPRGAYMQFSYFW